MEFLRSIFERALRKFEGCGKIAGGKEAVLNELSHVDVYLRREYDFASTVFNLTSLMNWFNTYGKTVRAAFVNMVDLLEGKVKYSYLASITAISDLIPDEASEKSVCTLIFRLSKELQDWRDVFNIAMSPQTLRKFLQQRQSEYNEAECGLFSSMCCLNMSVSRNYELFDEGGVDRKLTFDVKQGSDFTILPRSFNIEVPMLFGDNSKFVIPVDLEFLLPTEDNGNKPSFRLLCPFLDRLLMQRVEMAVDEFEKLTGVAPMLGDGITVDITPEYKNVLGKSSNGRS